jgi:hypothetical protein
MFQSGRLQQSLCTLLALLIVTPQVLLRPCCCARERSSQEVTLASSEQSVEASALPPCCQKRLRAAQQTASARAAEQLPGIHDSSRCACRISNQMARTNRVDFNGLLLRHIVVWMQHIKADAVRTAQPQVLTSSAHSAFPDWGAESCTRLCRWLV